jgi:D-alanyl-D-alanine-carboxypeptidase/D-alanyl-D-alanine-endopeptidase
VWVELLIALIVEGYRAFMEWWQTRSFLRPLRATGDADSADGLEEHEGDRTALVADTVGSILERHARKHVGVVVGVLWEGERWTFARGRLCATDAAPLDANSFFEIGSVTKVFTATLLADMVEQGRVRLDDPVQRHLPEHARLPVRGRPITLCDLATQTSGLPRLPPGLFRRSLRRRHDPYEDFSEQDLIHTLARTRLKGPPAVRLRYSNFGFGLLGYVLASRAGTSYGQLVGERICAPLGLADTGIEVAEDVSGRFADGHNRRGRRVPHWHFDALAGAGGLRSTVNDLLHFLDLQLTEPTIRLARAAHATHTPQARRGRLEQGLGWVSLPLRGDPRRMLWHNGGTGGFRSFLGFVPDTKVGVVVLSNSARSVDAIGFRILESTSRAQPPATAPAKTSRSGSTTRRSEPSRTDRPRQLAGKHVADERPPGGLADDAVGP